MIYIRGLEMRSPSRSEGKRSGTMGKYKQQRKKQAGVDEQQSVVVVMCEGEMQVVKRTREKELGRGVQPTRSPEQTSTAK